MLSMITHDQVVEQTGNVILLILCVALKSVPLHRPRCSLTDFSAVTYYVAVRFFRAFVGFFHWLLQV